MFKTGHIPSHKGRTTTADPIKTLEGVRTIKALLADDVRGLALWTMAVNTAFRSGDLCSLKWEDLQDNGGTITVRTLEGKTKKPRTVIMNASASAVLREWRKVCECEYIYSGQRGRLTTAAWGRMIKDWCERAGNTGNFSGHSARKTFVRCQHDEFGTSLPVLMTILNHSSERVTLGYMGRLGDDVQKAYGHAI